MSPPNRIRELRKAQHLSADDLAERIGTSQVQISRLERGERNLTVEWMMKISQALNCAPEDLLGPIALTQFEDEAALYDSGNPEIDRALAQQNKFLYISRSSALEALGIGPTDPILFDMSASACQAIRTGDVVIVQLMDRDNSMQARTLVRQYIAPDLLTTNRPGRNFTFHLEEESFTAQIRGVHRPSEANGHN